MLLTALTSLGDKRASHLPQQLHNIHCTHSEPVWCSRWVASVEIRYHHSTFPDILQQRLIQAAYFSDRALHQSHPYRNVWFWLSLWQPDLRRVLFLSNLRRHKKAALGDIAIISDSVSWQKVLWCADWWYTLGTGLPKYWIYLSKVSAYQRSTNFMVSFLNIHGGETAIKKNTTICQENVSKYICRPKNASILMLAECW